MNLIKIGKFHRVQVDEHTRAFDVKFVGIVAHFAKAECSIVVLVLYSRK